MVKKTKKSRKKIFIFAAVFILLIIAVSAVSYNKGKSNVLVTGISPTPIESIQEEYPNQEIPIASEQKLDFTVTSGGRGKLSTFDIIVWTTNGEEINLGDFSFALRQVEEIGPHDSFFENYIDYFIPDSWNSSQQLTETVTVKETTRKPIRALIADEPLFIRGVDYPETVPFEEIEIQVDLVNFFSDVNETEYVAWVRILEVEKAFDIKKVIIEGYKSEQK